MRRMWVSEELKDHGVPLELGVTDLRVEESCVRFTTSAGAARTIPMDNVIIAKGAAGERSLADALLSAGLEVRVVGDAEIGRAHDTTPVTNAQLVCRHLLETQN